MGDVRIRTVRVPDYEVTMFHECPRKLYKILPRVCSTLSLNSPNYVIMEIRMCFYMLTYMITYVYINLHSSL
jgi:hypothetical protein